jgi:hypothetical protein
VAPSDLIILAQLLLWISILTLADYFRTVATLPAWNACPFNIFASKFIGNLILRGLSQILEADVNTQHFLRYEYPFVFRDFVGGHVLRWYPLDPLTLITY